MHRLLGGMALLGLSLFMLMGFFKAELENRPLANSLAFGIAVVLPMTGGLSLLYLHSRKKRILVRSRDNLRRKTLQAEILKLASVRNGKLTIIEVMTELEIELEAATIALNSLTHQNIAEVEVTESGILVYSFYDIQHLSEKSSSRGILDA